MKCENGRLPRQRLGGPTDEFLPACDRDATHRVGLLAVCPQHAKGLAFFHRKYGEVQKRRLTAKERDA